MTEPSKSIAVIQGAPSAAIQALLRDFVASLGPAVRVAGVLEEDASALDAAAGEARLCSLGDARRYPIFQDLGPGSTACSLDADGVVTACEAVRRDIAAGCDLVVLSKFGKLEAGRSGLAWAFVAAVEAQAPILTSVAPKFDAEWTAFAAPLFVILPPDESAIQRWWDGVAR
jgi:hypothetical protein